ncbi:MAG: outer membrane lipoprotein carrier protein LolA [Proteobacteria bacterium]|nr:outer membrane lipoprotein carrier protein LolA [Desulfobacteraceae bacterium]MBU4012765.1 outer membrane lipoprotein carrier protein LolA [Pseudomonadota bacterium]MBU4127853.1 outer membrane lipoprotein carrier protein LolA [Pseudomonadota bacterium]
MQRALILLILFLFIPANYCYAETSGIKTHKNLAPDLYEVLHRLEDKTSEIRTLKTEFVQEKELAVFKKKIILKGMIFLQKPELFAWHIIEPLSYSMVIKGDILSQWDENTKKIQKISLSKNPAFQIAISQMKDWFSGKYTSMTEDYNIIILKRNPVSLKFIPKKNTIVSNVIESVTVIFRDDERYIHQIYIKEKSSNSTLLTFVNTQLNTPLEAAAWEVQPRVR